MSFAALLAGAEPREGGFDVAIPPDWHQGRTAYGGLSAALALESASRVGGEMPPLRSCQVGFVGPLYGPVDVRARVLRRGRVVHVERKGRKWRLTTHGASHLVSVLPAHVAELSHHMIEKAPPDLSKFLLCPMPGLLTALHVGEGDKVEAGQPLAVVEAMKMENILRAEKTGTVAKVAAQPGESLAVDAVIMEFE